MLPLCNVLTRPFIPRKGAKDQTQITPPAFFSHIVSSNFLLSVFLLLLFLTLQNSHLFLALPPNIFFFFCSLPKTGKHDFIHNPPTVESVKSLVMKRCGHLRPIGLSCIRLAHTKMLRCRLCGLCVSSTASG